MLNIEEGVLVKSQVAKKAIANVLPLECHVLELANVKVVKTVIPPKHYHQAHPIDSADHLKLLLQLT